MPTKVRKSPRIINAFAARTHLGRIMTLASQGERFVLTKKGKPKVVILGVEDFEELLEIIAEQQDKAFQAALRESARQYKRGDVSNLETLRKIYRQSA